MAQGRRYVFDSAQRQHAYYQVPQRRQQLRRIPGSHLARVFAKDHVRTQCSRFSIPQWPRQISSSRAVSARSGGRLVMA